MLTTNGSAFFQDIQLLVELRCLCGKLSGTATIMKNTFKSAINDAKNTTKLVLYISMIYEPRAGPNTILAPNVPVI